VVRERTSDDVDQLVSDSGLTATIVLHCKPVNHIRCILGGIVHGIATIHE
jgi:hypothetical protein